MSTNVLIASIRVAEILQLVFNPDRYVVRYYFEFQFSWVWLSCCPTHVSPGAWRLGSSEKVPPARGMVALRASNCILYQACRLHEVGEPGEAAQDVGDRLITAVVGGFGHCGSLCLGHTFLFRLG